MKAIILAAGRGSRMGMLTDDKPKCQVTVLGKTLLQHCMDTLQSAGFSVEDIGIVTGYRKEAISEQGVRFFWNSRWGTTNMVYTLTKAREWLEQEPCIVCYSDVIFHKNVILRLKQCQDDIALPYFTGYWDLWSKRFSNPLDDLEVFRHAGGKLVEIGCKPECKDQVQGQYMGLLRFSPFGWRQVEKLIDSPLVEKIDMTTLLQKLLENGNNISVYASHEPWLECDTVQDMHLYEQMYGGSWPFI